MTTPVWEAGNLYVPGDLVRPISQPAPVPAQLSNGGFTAGATGWTFSGGVIYTATGGYGGGGCCTIPGSQPDGVALADDEFVVPTGQAITAACVIQQGASDVDHTRGWAELQWFNSSDVLLRTDRGNVVNDGRGGAWHASSVTAYAPVGAAYVRAGIGLHQGSNDNVWGDNLTVIGAYAALPNGLIYKAVQADPGYSGSSEPAWPPTLGVTVVDNQVTWEAVTTSRVTWTAEPLLVSGTVEPEWPTQPGAVISDGTIQWECISRRVEDEKCPNTKVVAIMAGKVYAADGDIVRFSATSNPLDWSSQDDAGFLPTGLQQANANDMAVLAPYRANLAAFNASSFQNWQVDPDPAAMAILDQMDGVGSTWPKAATAVGNELFFLAALGVRTVGISAGAENLAAGDVGQPIDTLVQDAMRVTVANGGKALSTYYPSAGQYWLTFPDYPPAALAITGDVPDGAVGETSTGTYTNSGGVRPVAYEVLSGTFPPGLTMDSDGSWSGAYTTLGTFNWVVQGTDADGNTATVNDTATVTFNPIETLQRYLLISFADATDYSPPGFDDSAWSTGLLPLGTSDRPDAATEGFPEEIATEWPLTNNAWFRGRFNLLETADMSLQVYLDDAADVYINGTLVFSHTTDDLGGTDYYYVETVTADKFVLGENVIAIKCRADIHGVNNYVAYRLVAL